MRQRPLWIVEPPLSTGERMSVNDPQRPFATDRYLASQCYLQMQRLSVFYLRRLDLRPHGVIAFDPASLKV